MWTVPIIADNVYFGTQAVQRIYQGEDFLWPVRRFTDVQMALNANRDLTPLIGKQVYMQKNGEQIGFIIVDYDADAHEVTLFSAYLLAQTVLPFDNPQALMWFENGLAAGSYAIELQQTYYFTLNTDIPVGGQLRAYDWANAQSYWTYANSLSSNALESGRLSTTAIAGAVFLGREGTGLLNSRQRVAVGSNNFGESWLFRWLNSDAAAGAQLPQITKFERPYTVNKPGFLNGIAQEDLACIKNTEWKCSANKVYECPPELGGITNANESYTVYGKFALASEKELYGTYGGVDAGDYKLDLAYSRSKWPKVYAGTKYVMPYYLRSPNWKETGYGRSVDSSGSPVVTSMDSSYIAPMCKIAKTVV